MGTDNRREDLISPALLAQVEALAAVEHRSAREMLREAVERYLQERRTLVAEQPPRRKRSPQEAVARILELRKGNALPEGVTIRDLMTVGRA